MSERPPYLGPLYVAAIVGAIVCLFWPTAHELMASDLRAGGYSHRLLVLPAFLAMVWSLRDELSALPVQPFWPGLAGLAAAGVVWLAGELLYTGVLADIALVAMVPCAVLTVLGRRWVSQLAFPLAVLLFAVPIETPLVPPLVSWTSTVAELGIRASGVPIHREGAYLIVPSGAWNVADTCSGIAFFTTSLMLGVLYAWSMYRSWQKRMLFVAGAVVIGICGNWIRVYLTIMVAHLSDNHYLRDDHYAFGWVLYAIFLFLFCWWGWTWRDEDAAPDHPAAPAPRAGHAGAGGHNRRGMPRALAAGAAALLLAAVWPAAELALASQHPPRAVDIAAIVPAQGWVASGPASGWRPDVRNPVSERVQSFEKDGRRIDVYIGVFRNQTWSSKLVSSVNQFADVDGTWTLIERGTAGTQFAGEPLNAASGVVLGQGMRLAAWRWYWLNNRATASDARAKVTQMLVRLRGADDTSAWVAVSTPFSGARSAADAGLQQFLRDMGEPLRQALVRTCVS